MTSRPCATPSSWAACTPSPVGQSSSGNRGAACLPAPRRRAERPAPRRRGAAARGSPFRAPPSGSPTRPGVPGCKPHTFAFISHHSRCHLAEGDVEPGSGAAEIGVVGRLPAAVGGAAEQHDTSTRVAQRGAERFLLQRGTELRKVAGRVDSATSRAASASPNLPGPSTAWRRRAEQEDRRTRPEQNTALLPPLRWGRRWWARGGDRGGNHRGRSPFAPAPRSDSRTAGPSRCSDSPPACPRGRAAARGWPC